MAHFGLKGKILHQSVKSGIGLFLKVALKLGPDVAAADSDGMTALMWAARGRNLMAIRLLLTEAVEIDAKDNDGNTALIWATRCNVTGDPDAENWMHRITGNLLSYDAEPDLRNNKGQSPLMLASASGQLSAAKSLIVMGAEINDKDAGGRTPLTYAKQNGQDDIAEALIEKGAVGE